MGRGGVNEDDVGRVAGPVVGREGGHFTAVETLHPFCREVEASTNGDFEQWESIVLHVPFQGIFIDFLVLLDFVPESPNLVSKAILNLSVGVLPILAGLNEAMAEAMECGFINVNIAGNEGAFG
jgi:hypothetical protein